MSRTVLVILIFTIVTLIASILMGEYVVAAIDGLMVIAVFYIAVQRDENEDYFE